MATIKDIRRRIKSVKSTQQITKAMEMVAAAKLRRAQDRILQARPYAAKMTEVLKQLASAAGEVSDPLFDVRTPVRHRTIVVIASDKGLCGAFNANLFRHVEGACKGVDRGTINLVPVGRRANDYFGKRGWKGDYRVPELGDQVNLTKAVQLARYLIDLYRRGGTDSVELVYTKFITTGTRKIVQETFLPITPEKSEHAHPRDYIFEPDAAAIFSSLLPSYVQTRVQTAFADSIASEHAARLISMGAATKNAGEMISVLTLIRNKLRQAAITKEISELVGGAEALK
jgi:F-type H+-transporting ATPase subunit gamma